MGSLMRAIALAVACVATTVSAAPSAIAAPFDGEWSFLVKTADHCGNSQWGFTIIDGQVQHRQIKFIGGFFARVAGQVSPSGEIKIDVVAGPRFVSSTGRLGNRQGSGKWAGRGPSGTCAGNWTATRTN